MAVSLHHSKTQGTTKLVLLGIANHEGDGGAWPSINTLARYAGGVNRRTVQRAIQELIDLGEITCDVNGGGNYGDSRPNLYRVTLRCPNNCDGSTAHRKTEGGGLDVTPRGGLDVTGGAVSVSPKPSLEPSVKNLTYPQASLEGEFNEFWEVYPRKVDKLAARKAFEKAVALVGLEVVVAGARRIATDPNLPPKQFIPYPATWLNAGGWDSEPYPERERTAEEKQAIAKAEAERRRAVELEHVAKLRAEQEEAKRRSAPPPKCPHGKTIVSCRVCLRQQ